MIKVKPTWLVPLGRGGRHRCQGWVPDGTERQTDVSEVGGAGHSLEN